MMIDWPAIADVSLTGALVVAVVTLWRENQELVKKLIEREDKAESQRMQIFQQLAVLATRVGVVEDDQAS